MDLLYVLFLLVPTGVTPGETVVYKWEGQPMTFETKQLCEQAGAGMATETLRINSRIRNTMIDKSIAGSYCQKRKAQ